MVLIMIEKQSESGRDIQLAMLLRNKWQTEIEKAVDKVKLGCIPAKKRKKADKWFRKQWYRTMMRDRRKKARDGKTLTGLERRALEHPEWQDEPTRKH
jgi:hypothetical protein